MSPAAERRPLQQQQFDPRTVTSSYDCTPTTVAVIADADTRGKLVYTGRQVRLSSDEPKPNPNGSPGLSLPQGDAAIRKRSNGKVTLDVRVGALAIDVNEAERRIAQGRWAALQFHRGILVDRGYGGTSTFRLGHASPIGYDQVRKRPILGDTLVPGWQPAKWNDLWDAAAALIVRQDEGHLVRLGQGKAYLALSRDVYDEVAKPIRYSIAFDPGSFFVYDVPKGSTRARDIRESMAFTKLTSAPCAAPLLFGFKGSNRLLARITKGGLAGRYVEPDTSHVVLMEA